MNLRPPDRSTLLPALLVAALLAFAPANSPAAQPKLKVKASQVNTPDMWVVNPAPGTLPSGVTHHTYHSDAMHCDVGYCIYLPPGYAKHNNRRFPVIYH